MAYCALCNEHLPIIEILNHVRVFHPNDYGDGIDVWPDGNPVIIDTDPSPHEVET
jgi:hypothetical protein